MNDHHVPNTREVRIGTIKNILEAEPQTKTKTQQPVLLLIMTYDRFEPNKNDEKRVGVAKQASTTKAISGFLLVCTLGLRERRCYWDLA